MSIGRPMSLPSAVVAFFTFHDTYCEAILSAPRVLRSTKRSALSPMNEGLSSPLTPEIEGRKAWLVMVVSSFCLKSPPITDGVSLVWVKWATASLRTFALRQPSQTQMSIFLPARLVEPEPDEEAPQAPTARLPPVSRPAWSSLLRESSIFAFLRGGSDIVQGGEDIVEKGVVAAELRIAGGRAPPVGDPAPARGGQRSAWTLERERGGQVGE